jgi:hypothetical protein
MTKTVSQILLFWLLAGGLAVAAEAELRLLDRTLIGEMLAQYSYRWDGKDSAGFAALFTEDGVMERWVSGARVDGSVVSGRTGIFEYARTSHQGRLADRQTRHHFSALVFLELSEDQALTENMALITHQTAGNPPVIASSGIYRVSWRKTDQGWRMVKRILFTDRFDP